MQIRAVQEIRVCIFNQIVPYSHLRNSKRKNITNFFNEIFTVFSYKINQLITPFFSSHQAKTNVQIRNIDTPCGLISTYRNINF